MSFTVIDWIFSGLILILAFSGLIKGFVNSILWANEFNWEKTVRQTLAII